MLDNLRKKKMLESLGVNKTVDKTAPNDLQDETIQKMEPMHISNKEMAKTPLKKQINDGMGSEKDSIHHQKEAMTLGIDTTDQKEEKRKKMLESLFLKKR